MYQKKIVVNYSCGVLITSEILTGKWKACLINRIYEGVKRPNELQKSMPDASRRALNIQLNELLLHGIIEKKIYPVLPPKVEYYLTEVGESLIPITRAMEEWGENHREKFFCTMKQEAAQSK